MLTIWGRATSLNVQAVMWTVAELDLPHRRVDWGGRFGGNDDVDYRAMNPNGLIPTLRDGTGTGDVVVWESPAIVRYLGARFGRGDFWPEDPAARAPLDMWAEWARSSVYPALGRIFHQLVRTREPARDMTEVAAGAEALIALLPRLDARLGDGPWLCGQHPCFADVMVGHLLYRYMTLDFVKGPTPAIDAWYARLTGRPAFRDHVMVSYESLRPG